MIRKLLLFSFFLIIFSYLAKTQNCGFDVYLEEIYINDSPAIHSGAVAHWEDKWLIIGGRTNGLHGFLPPFAFPSSGINTNVWVVDPILNQSLSFNLDSLPTHLRESLTSSNMQFFQNDSILYMLGGYGWSDSLNDFMTFNTLTSIDIPGLIDAVEQQQDISSYFRQIKDDRFFICGGNLQKIDSTYYLVFGHNFNGRYDEKKGTGFFTQEYSNEIRKFSIIDNYDTLFIANYTAIADSINFHRRDYNLIPQIFPDASFGLTAFSGVFQYGIDIPYFNSIDIFSNMHSVNDSFYHHLANYQCATMPVYDGNAMHNVFFGGTSMYYIDSTGNMLVDSLVPFINTISVVSRYSDGTMNEYSSQNKMPALLGTNAHFFPKENLTHTGNIIHYLNPTTFDSLHVGYIFGGIKSPMPNISKIDASISEASSHIYKVYLYNSIGNENEIEPPFLFQCYPNPVNKNLNISIAPFQKSVKIEIFNSEGSVVKQIKSNTSLFSIDTKNYENGLYYIKVSDDKYLVVNKFIVFH